MKRYVWAFVCMLLLLRPVISMAGDRALLIGVGDYSHPGVNILKGIDLDIIMMQEIASLMGFGKDQIEILENSDATYLNVKRAMQRLIDQVGADDKVLIYFSLHGSYIADRNGDEEDGRDEVILLHDMRVVKDASGEAKLENVLTDDELSQSLGQIRSHGIMVMMDCCHSGTNTRSIKLHSSTVPVSEVQEKFFYYPGMPKSIISPDDAKPQSDSHRLNYVSLAACRDTEQSLASPHGSYFTLGIRNAFRQAAAKDQSLTPAKLTMSAAAFIDHEILEPSKKFHPQIEGNEDLKQKKITLASMHDGYGPVWQDLARLADSATGQVPIQINKSRYEVGDALIMDFQIPRDGYLNVISVGADDEPTVLFPNKLHPDTVKTSKGTVQIPTTEMSFKLTAIDKGPVMIVALLTSKPINLYADGFKTKDQMFASLSPKAFRSGFGVTKKESDFFCAGKRITQIVQPGK